MNIRKKLSFKRIQDLAAFVTILVAFPTLIGWIISLFDKSNSHWITNIVNMLPLFFNLSIVFALIFLGLSLWRLHRRFTINFTDNFKHQLNEKWEYEGDWKIIEDGILAVRNSDVGGITNVGSGWENYDFEFETRIINKFSTWIIRARV